MRRKNLAVVKKVEKNKLSIQNLKIKKIYTKFKAVIFKKIGRENFALAVSGGPDSLCLAYFGKMYTKNKIFAKIQSIVSLLIYRSSAITGGSAGDHRGPRGPPQNH